MYCIKCGKENQDDAGFCTACGSIISAAIHEDRDPWHTQPGQVIPRHYIDGADNLQGNPGIKKLSVFLQIILAVITLGLYVPVWFLMRRNDINRLNASAKLGTSIFVIVIVVSLISLLIGITAAILETEGSFSAAKDMDLISRVLDLFVWISILVQSFKVKRIFNEHFNTSLQRAIPFSGAATFFFHIFYLQYKINRF